MTGVQTCALRSHNLAIALHQNGLIITGSDDEIYSPAKERLAKYHLLPAKEGWFPDRINQDLDAVILGMHARLDNPELEAAQKQHIPIYSFPEFIYEHAAKKKRIVVAGSHGKTTTTAMIMHILRACKFDFDYLVGAQLDGFETMVRLSDAPLIVIEGDEYLSSPLDRRPKFLHYQPDITVITGIAWDHINVFPTFENYLDQFKQLIDGLSNEGTLIYYKNDEYLPQLLSEKEIELIPYAAFDAKVEAGGTFLVFDGQSIPIEVFGQHNLENLKSTYFVCKKLGITDQQFLEHVATFKGAAKRLQKVVETSTSVFYRDFAHAPSKVKATIQAFQSQYAERHLTACVELHTFSSLNKSFLPHYHQAMNAADTAYVFFSEHTIRMKKLPPIFEKDIIHFFGHPNLKVFTDPDELKAELLAKNWENHNLLMMSSGTFKGIDFEVIGATILNS